MHMALVWTPKNGKRAKMPWHRERKKLVACACECTRAGRVACLEVVTEYIHGHSQANAPKPFDEHLREALRILLTQRVEKIPSQEVEEHTADATLPAPHLLAL